LEVDEVEVVLETGCEGSLEDVAVEDDADEEGKADGGAGASLSDPLSQASSFSQDECDWESEKERAAREEAGGRRRDLLDVLITRWTRAKLMSTGALPESTLGRDVG
jgi:hypothetical protein